MTTRAVVFDLFGTLVTYPPGVPHVRLVAEMLGLDREAFRRAWHELRSQRDAGLGTLAAIRACCDQLGTAVDPAALDAACSALARFWRDLLTPRDGALATIAALRERGLRLGLISDANVDVPRAWAASAFAPLFDVAVFSCDERLRKPDPHLYNVACARLAVAAESCLYVGNGDGDELSGATAVGMRAVLFTAPGEAPGRDAARWMGPRISDLNETLAFF